MAKQIDILFKKVDDLFDDFDEKYEVDYQVDLFEWLVRDLYLRLRDYDTIM